MRLLLLIVLLTACVTPPRTEEERVNAHTYELSQYEYITRVIDPSAKVVCYITTNGRAISCVHITRPQEKPDGL